MIIPRELTKTLEKELASDKVIVLTGMRRVGKTTLINYLYNQINRQKKIYLDLENPLNHEVFADVDYDKIRLNLTNQATGKGKGLTVFLDEVQYVPKIPSVVKYLVDHYKIKFILTGSASFYLKNLFSESLAGRKRIFELFPLSFDEFMNYKNPQLKKLTISDKVNKYQYNLRTKYIDEYLNWGGFPSVVLKDSPVEKKAELGDIFTSYWQKEVRLLSDFRKLDAIRQAIILLSQRVGSRLDISKIASELGIARITLTEYLDFLQGTYFLNLINAYSRKKDVILRSQAKPYFSDSGLLKQTASISPSAVLENTVFNLIKNENEVFYYQSRGGAEIDFILDNKKKTALEVKTFGHQSDVRRLARTARRLKILKYFVVSQKYSPMKKVVYPFQL